ncbi:MAG TPA: cytochrome c3 family protein [Pyrinomonadaceae bacterium]
MTDAHDKKGSDEGARSGRHGGARTAAAHTRVRLLVLLCLAALPCVYAFGRLTPAAPAPAAAQEGGVSKFSHSIPQHASRDCNSCHQREDNSPRPRLPGHKACTDCHIQQFLTAGGPLCTNCHSSLEGGNPPLKAFPGLSGFNMRFDHARHAAGGARPAQGCATCHRPARRGVALSIPAGASAHDNCYSCHTPGARGPAGDISSCATCHTQGGYSRTPQNARAYSVSFSHATHGARQGLRCDECHQVRAGAGQGRQVTAPRPTQHFGSGRAQTCMTCHNNRRAFGGDDFADCKRCHKGQTFRF